ncbi:MAG: GNAT family N-acetyltransferase [Vibrio sp.]
MLIRTEAPADILFVEQLLTSVFPSGDELSWVTALRENGRRTLSLVACTDEGEHIGYILFSPLVIDGEDSHWQVMSLVGIDENFRQQGVASELVKEGLTTLVELGYPGCVVADPSSFWQKLGFRALSREPAGKIQLFSFDAHQLPDGKLSYGTELYGLSLTSMR